MSTFCKFKYENVMEVKNKPDPALLRTSYLSNEIKKDTQMPLIRLQIKKKQMTYNFLKSRNRSNVLEHSFGTVKFIYSIYYTAIPAGINTENYSKRITVLRRPAKY
jgi:hypothetical protein